MCFVIALLSGRAQYSGLYHSFIKKFLSASLKFNLIFFSCKRSITSAKDISIILVNISLSRGLNTIISSILFINSGVKCLLSCQITFSFISENFDKIFGFFDFSDTSNHISLFSKENSLLQIFEVIIIIVFLKLTVLHLLSVSLPSSRICKNILNTSR
jgi:hypothetical protein